MDRFASKVNAGIYAEEERLSKELERLNKYFELPELGPRNEPATVLDEHGRILVWYLPDILSIQRVVSFRIPSLLPSTQFCQTYQGDYNNAIHHIRRSLSVEPDPSGNLWRSEGFRDPGEEHLFGPGLLTFSPGWFMRGRNVSPVKSSCLCLFYLTSPVATQRAVAHIH